MSENLSKRTRLRPVYLTDVERDLLVSGMRVLRSVLEQNPSANEKATNFAKSFTGRRIDEVVLLLLAVDKPATPAQA